MSSSFTAYAQNFINNIVIPPNFSPTGQNVNFFVNNSNINIQNKETYNISNNILVINKYGEAKGGPNEENEISKNFTNRIVVKNENPSKDQPYEQEILFDNNLKINVAKMGDALNLGVNGEEIKKEKDNQYLVTDGNAPKERVDAKGEPIVRGGKKHKVTFIDRLGNKKTAHLAQKIEVESFKALNILNTFSEAESKRASSSGSCCSIF